jgi:hypothetical protein
MEASMQPSIRFTLKEFDHGKTPLLVTPIMTTLFI